MCRAAAFLLFAAAIFHAQALPARSILEAGSSTTWKFHSDSPAPDATWNQPGFDDSKWKSGKAPLGFGEKRLDTVLESKPFTAWFRNEFDAPKLMPGEGLVILLCVDDGAVVYLNGKELARTNMPDGLVDSTTAALRTIGDDEEGFYIRLRVPLKLIQAGAKNGLAVEVHNVSAKSSDIYFDLALKTVPVQSTPEVSATSKEAVTKFNQNHYLGPDVRIPDGYIDGGRNMKIDANGHATSRREILSVNLADDAELSSLLAFARSAELRGLPELERLQRIVERIDRETTPPGGSRWVETTTEVLEDEYAGKKVLIGDWMDQGQAGVCRHRSLVFKILADEAGLNTALVRGNYLKGKPPGFPHVWNEVFLSDHRRILVDVMHHGGKPNFFEVTDPYVIQHYLKVNDTPWYGSNAQP